jgi:hypothetical protein
MLVTVMQLSLVHLEMIPIALSIGMATRPYATLTVD